MNSNKRLYLIISLLLLLTVIVSVIVYQISRVEPIEDTALPNPNILTDEQRNTAIENLQEVASKSPPLTDKERVKIIADLKEASANQNK